LSSVNMSGGSTPGANNSYRSCLKYSTAVRTNGYELVLKKFRLEVRLLTIRAGGEEATQLALRWNLIIFRRD